MGDDAGIGALMDSALGEVHCAYAVADPWNMLVAAILAPGCADIRVRHLTAVLSEHFLGPAAFLHTHPADLERSLGLIPARRAKARAIMEAARAIAADHGGVVPLSRDELLRLPGLNRQVAERVCAFCCNTPAVLLDTEGLRPVVRLGWCQRNDLAAARHALQERLPPHAWILRSLQFCHIGRAWCRPRHAKCERCPLDAVCPKIGVDPTG